jgi:hypothetical protein
MRQSFACALRCPVLKRRGMNRRQTISNPLARVAVQAILAICLFAAAATGAPAQTSSNSATPYEPASIRAAPGLQCKLHGTDAAFAAAITVFTDRDGYARFYAVRAKPDGLARRFILDCKDAAGKTSAYPVDLASEDTFAPHPIDLSREPGVDRPALKGDPLKYTETQLLDAGYGMRPDPTQSPDAYASWLAAANQSGRLLTADRPLVVKHNVATATDGLWTGSMMTGGPNYTLIQGNFNVPTAVPGGDQTTATAITVWVGVGGSRGPGLMQDGIDIQTTPVVANYFTFQEYCCGDPNQTTGGAYNVSPNDQLFAQAWYCDSKGNRSPNGGYGCAFVQDLTSGAIMSCTVPGGSPCGSVKANVLCSVSPTAPNCFVLGSSAEFIVENDTPQVSSTGTQFTDFTGKITMAGSAFTTATNSLSATISTDPAVTLLTDWTNASTHILVALGTTNQTYFNIEPGQPYYGFYCQGPLKTSPAPTPLTPFKWASKGAGAAAPGPGECAWADRAPRGTEIKEGGGNVISGYLNQQANLPVGTFMELGVYNDPAARNDMVVYKAPKLVTPPFPSTSAP